MKNPALARLAKIVHSADVAAGIDEKAKSPIAIDKLRD